MGKWAPICQGCLKGRPAPKAKKSPSAPACQEGSRVLLQLGSGGTLAFDSKQLLSPRVLVHPGSWRFIHKDTGHWAAADANGATQSAER